MNAGKKNKESQLEALMRILSHGKYQNGQIESVAKKEIEDLGVSASSIKSLEKNGIIVLYKQALSRLLDNHGVKALDKPELTSPQIKALDSIKTSFEDQRVCLLHGVTGSGKTEIYIHLIEEQLKLGNQVLFLILEIALTTQLVTRLRKYFGEYIGVYHSKFNQNERIEIWNKVLHNDTKEYRIILGARSAVFLPFRQLGLVIVDGGTRIQFQTARPFTSLPRKRLRCHARLHA